MDQRDNGNVTTDNLDSPMKSTVKVAGDISSKEGAQQETPLSLGEFVNKELVRPSAIATTQQSDVPAAVASDGNLSAPRSVDEGGNRPVVEGHKEETHTTSHENMDPAVDNKGADLLDIKAEEASQIKDVAGTVGDKGLKQTKVSVKKDPAEEENSLLKAELESAKVELKNTKEELQSTKDGLEGEVNRLTIDRDNIKRHNRQLRDQVLGLQDEKEMLDKKLTHSEQENQALAKTSGRYLMLFVVLAIIIVLCFAFQFFAGFLWGTPHAGLTSVNLPDGGAAASRRLGCERRPLEDTTTVGSAPVIGIDFGTEDTIVSVVHGGRIRTLKRLPTYVAHDGVNFLVGDTAKARVSKRPKQGVNNIKRILGLDSRREEKTIQINASTSFGWNVSGRLSGGVTQPLVTLSDDITLPPQGVAAILLAHVKADASSQLGVPINDVVLTVPTGFSSDDRRTVQEAAALADMNVLRLVNEPTAAALAFSISQDQQKIVLVMDLGSGSLDVSIVNVHARGKVSVLGTSGDRFLGTINFSETLADYLAAEFAARHGDGFDPREDVSRKAMRKLLEESRDAMRKLSLVDSTMVDAYSLYKGEDMTMTLTRRQVEHICSALFDEVQRHLERAMQVSNAKAGDIDHVLLVGESSQMPKIKQIVREYFERDDSIFSGEGYDINDVVSHGAALVGAMLQGGSQRVGQMQVADISYDDVLTHGYSVVCSGQDPSQRHQPQLLEQSKLPLSYAITCPDPVNHVSIESLHAATSEALLHGEIFPNGASVRVTVSASGLIDTFLLTSSPEDSGYCPLSNRWRHPTSDLQRTWQAMLRVGIHADRI